MVRVNFRQNNGPCAVCGQQISGEKYRKLSENLLAKAIKSSAIQQLTFELKLNDQLCQLHYNNFVVYDRGIIKSQNKRKNMDLSYYSKDTKQRKVSLSQEAYDELTQQIEGLELQLNQMERAKEPGDFLLLLKSNLIEIFYILFILLLNY